MLGTDARVVETGGDGMGVDDLAVLVLQQISAVAVQYAGHAGSQRSRVASGFDAFARRLDANQADACGRGWG